MRNIKLLIIVLLIVVILLVLFNKKEEKTVLELIKDLSDNTVKSFTNITKQIEPFIGQTVLNNDTQEVMDIINNNKINKYIPDNISKEIIELQKNIDPITINKSNIISNYYRELENQIENKTVEFEKSEIPSTYIKTSNGVEFDLFNTIPLNPSLTDKITTQVKIPNTENNCLLNNNTSNVCDTNSAEQKYEIVRIDNKDKYNNNIHSSLFDNFKLITSEFTEQPFNILKVDCNDCNKANHCLNIEQTDKHKYKMYVSKCDNTKSQRFYV